MDASHWNPLRPGCNGCNRCCNPVNNENTTRITTLGEVRDDLCAPSIYARESLESVASRLQQVLQPGQQREHDENTTKITTLVGARDDLCICHPGAPPAEKNHRLCSGTGRYSRKKELL
jgi:hypothetical protein